MKLDAKILDEYIGVYQNKASETVTVHRDGDRLIGQAAGDPEFEMFPVGNDSFIVKVFDARMTFVKDTRGKTTGLIFHSADQEERYTRIK